MTAPVPAAPEAANPHDGTVLVLQELVTEISTPRGTVTPVDGVTLTVGAGETLGLVGESGSGKTMTAMSVAGLLPPTAHTVSGRIVLDGRDLAALPAAERRRVRAAEVGVVFQNPMTALNPRLTLGAQLREALPAEVRRSARAARRRSLDLLAQVGIARAADRLGDYPHELSGGLSQRAVLAMAIAREPRLLVADEPTTALDVSIQAQVLDLIDQLKRSLNLGVLLVTHDISVIAERADRVAVMYAGRIVEEGTRAQVLSRPRHRYTAGLLAAAPRPDADRAGVLVPIEGAPPVLIDVAPGCRFADRCAHAAADCRAADVPAVVTEDGHRHACLHPVPVDDAAEDAPSAAADGAAAERAPAADAPPVVAVTDAERAFALPGGRIGRRLHRSAVAGVSLEVHAGTTLGIVGESGCGKSTLARLLVGLDRPDAGSVTYDGVDIAGLGRRERRAWRRAVQLVFQDPYGSLDPRLTVRAIIREPLELAGQRGGRSELDARVDALLDEVGLPRQLAGRRPAELSGGQRQRVGIARALALSPRVIVADEPVSALDLSVQATVLNLLRRLRAERDLTYVVISHDLGVIRYLCDEVAVMYLGRIVEQGPTEQVYRAPAHPYTAALLASAPGAAGGTGRRLRGEVPSAVRPPSGCRFRTRCPLATDRCAQEQPLLTPVGRPPDGEAAAAGVRRVACHLPLIEAEAAVPA